MALTRVKGVAYADQVVDLAGDQTITGSKRGSIVEQTSLTVDLNAGNSFKITPAAGGSLTFDNIAGSAGQSGFIFIVNGSNYGIDLAGTTKMTVADQTRIAATGSYVMTYFSDGTNVRVMASGNLA